MRYGEVLLFILIILLLSFRKGYARSQNRALYADMNIQQDLSTLTPGLSASVEWGLTAMLVTGIPILVTLLMSLQ